jgi:hypothetical protein
MISLCIKYISNGGLILYEERIEFLWKKLNEQRKLDIKCVLFLLFCMN